MSSPIKPPSGSPPGPPPPEQAGEGEGAERAAGTFRPSPEHAPDPQQGPPVGDATEVGQVVEALRAGAIDVGQAVEQIVQRSLGGAAAQALPPAMRAELEAHIRQALADDPNLTALTKDLERGS